MMKKLLMWSALLMTGFAFYSCDDVVDNPVQDTSAVWNYAVNVKFADFNFGGLINPTTTEPYTYEAPKTLYVFNEQLQPLGEITTEKAPAAGSSAKYSGTLRGAIGDNLIIFTKTGAECAKQDGTIESAIENGIVQSATVAVKIYSNYNYNVSTEDAKMQNAAAIVKLASNDLYGGDKVAITTKDQSFEFTMNEDFNPTASNIIYAAIPTPKVEDKDITISTNSVDGFMRGVTLTSAAYPLTNGKINDYSAEAIPFQKTGVDLTIWAPQYRKDKNWSENAWVEFEYTLKDKESFEITQSSKEVKNLSGLSIKGNLNDKVDLILNNVYFEKDGYLTIQDGATFNITLHGENKFNNLNLNSPFTKKGSGTWSCNELNIGGSYHLDDNYKAIIDYAAEYTIDQDLELKHMSVANGGKLTIADGKSVTINSKNQKAVSVYYGTLKVGKESHLIAATLSNDYEVINLENGTIEIDEEGTLTSTAKKNGKALNIQTYDKQKTEFIVHKKATVTLIGGPEESIGYGLHFNTSGESTITNIKLEEGAELTATGIDRAGISFDIANWSTSDVTKYPILNLDIAKDASILAEDTGEQGAGLSIWIAHAAFNMTGEGLLDAKSNKKAGLLISGYECSINFKGGNISATGGTEKAGMEISTPITIAKEIKSFKAISKMTSNPLYISNGAETDPKEVELKDLVGGEDNVAKFVDKTENGARTITPKAE